jgi:hypothetical protein
MFTAAKDIRYAETKAGVTRPGIAPAQHIVDYVAGVSRPVIAPALHIVIYKHAMYCMQYVVIRRKLNF